MTEQNMFRWEADADGIVVLTMDDPDQSANTMNETFGRSLVATLDRLEAEKENITGVVITSAKKTFFAGGDLNLLMSARPQDAERVMNTLETMKAQFRRLETLGRPVVAAINGAALGGGYEIALSCHHRIALDARGSEIGLPEVTLGLLPGNGGTQRLQRLIGRGRALDMMVTGDPVGPQRALELGIVERVVPADKLHNEAVAYAAKLGKGATFAIGNIKIAAKQGAELPLDGALAFEREALWGVFESEDAAEGLTAFKEKRAPNWKGR
jgi:3-hydroxyacyl-CoA dehydrogenase/enoyl-CoA hydratase/3-hydroxybutyryl-CoA epimerase